MSVTIEELREQIRMIEVRLVELERQEKVEARERDKWERKKEAVAAFADAHFGIGGHGWYDVSFDNPRDRKAVQTYFAGLQKGFEEVIS